MTELLVRGPYSRAEYRGDLCWELDCCGEVCRLFYFDFEFLLEALSVPLEAHELEVSLHDCHFAGRLRVQLIREEDDVEGAYLLLRWGEGKDESVRYTYLDHSLIQFIGRTLWLQVVWK